jgi:UDP-N-acetylmuramyl pentapeptide phosphotransferase/UDP-N-acetylglucosamine-1-phosphate transferase
MYDIILSFITAFAITYFVVPSVIRVAKVKKLMDVPGERAAHHTPTPSLGGIAIFAGTVFAITLWTPFQYFANLQYILAAMIIIFLIGAKDDILPMSPSTKLVGQIFVALILVFRADVIINNFYGLFGIHELYEWFSVLFSIFVIILLINAFNLIDGINGLAASIGILISVVFGTWFFLIERVELAMVAFALTGALVAFLKYNITPAAIFMGDTGSMLVGFVCTILAIKCLETHNGYFAEKLIEKPYLGIYKMEAAPAVVIGILIIPLFDTLKVFLTRIIRGRSPFMPDKTHTHHLLLDTGLSHSQATSVLVLVNIVFVLVAFYFQSLGVFALMSIIIVLAIACSSVLFYIASKIRNKKKNELS